MKSNLLTIVFFLFVGLCILPAQPLELYVSDAGNFSSGFQILKFDGNGENGEVFINEQLSWPQDIVFLDNRNSVIISNLSSRRITEYDAVTGAYLGEFAAVPGEPTRMKIGADGLLYVLQWSGDGKVLRFDLDGNFVDNFTDVQVRRSIGLDWDNEGNLYVSSYSGDYVQKFSSTGEDMGRFIETNLVGPTNVWFDDDGNLIVIDYDGGAVKKFDASGNFLGVFISGIQGGEGVDFLPNGNILIGDGQDGAINMYDKDGNFIEEFIPGGTLGLNTPNVVILREVVTSVRETPEQVNFIAPTIGKEFRIVHTQSNSNIESFEVYDVQGRLQARIPYTGNTTFWNASSYAEGMYMIIAKRADGTAWSQKVVVKK